MNDNNGGNRGPRRAGALAALAAVAVLATACGSSASSSGSDSAESAAYQADLAFAQCMRGHGMPNFPDPRPGSGYNVSVSSNTSGPALQAYDTCKHLMPSGSTTTNTDGGQVTQQHLNQALMVTRCLRAHGEPNFPDPEVVNGNLNYNLNATVINPQSAQFQAAVSACRSLIPKGVNLP